MPPVVARDDSAPATKKDLQLLESNMDVKIQRLFSANKQWKLDINVSIEALMCEIGKLYDANERWKDEIINHFHVIAEDLRHDLLGIHKDKISLIEDKVNDHEERITVLESRPL